MLGTRWRGGAEHTIGTAIYTIIHKTVVLCGAPHAPPCSRAADLWSVAWERVLAFPPGGGRRSHGVAAENYIILNFCGRKQPPKSPQCASSASQREQRETEMAPGRSLVSDRLRGRVRVMGRVRGRFAARSLRMRDDAFDGVRHAPWIDRSQL